jgi:hypothetical protein
VCQRIVSGAGRLRESPVRAPLLQYARHSTSPNERMDELPSQIDDAI